jgi:hypothetical protein
MREDEPLLRTFEDLEQQAEGLHLQERAAEAAALAAAEYAAITLVDRIRACVGHEIVLTVRGGAVVRGRLERVGADWVVLADERWSWLVPLGPVVALAGLSDRTAPGPSRAVERLSLRSALRQLAEGREECVLHLLDTVAVRAVLGRVGQDFVEITPAGGVDRQVVPLGALVSVQVEV